MKRKACIAAAGVLALLCWFGMAGAVEISGTVRSTAGDNATIVTESEWAPNVGDPVTIFFKIPGTDDEISVASGKVTAVKANAIEAKIDSATGKVSKDQLVRITSEKPQKRPTPRQSLQTTPTAPPIVQPGTTAEPTDVGQIAAEVITFDQLAPGPISGEAFADRGVHLVKRKGTPGVYEAMANMVLPRPCKHVLLLADDHVTALSITFDSPVRRFVLFRIGTADGASVPTWTMKAYNRSGKVIGSTGEQHGLPPAATHFSLEGAGIVRVDLSTDNRHGKGTWATWSSLPVAAFGFDR